MRKDHHGAAKAPPETLHNRMATGAALRHAAVTIGLETTQQQWKAISCGIIALPSSGEAATVGKSSDGPVNVPAARLTYVASILSAHLAAFHHPTRRRHPISL
jgi:hypothetical protein